MIPSSFTYQKVKSVEEAIAALKESDSKILAGGHSLIPTMKLRLNSPAKLIDIGGISALKGIKESGSEIVIGAATTHAEIASSKVIQGKLNLFAQTASAIGDIQVRNRGTIGGSLAHADPAADWPAAVLAADATIAVQGAKGSRKIKASEFFQGLFTTALQEGEVITAVHVPVFSGKSVYMKFPQPASRYAIVGCAVVKHSDGKISIAYTGVSSNAFRDGAAEKAISGKKIDAGSAEVASKAAAEGMHIMSDHYASEKYRKHLAKVYLKRALLAVA
ncbi:MAG: xanthine dehydrogenase family protein subunit M [Bacteroidetes bacterium]|nr:xanthine dehydrogenase family protein subunit M [Bacteroidota bacterium]